MNVPVVTTFAAEEPEIMPIRPLAITAFLAGPPLYLPVSAYEKSTNHSPVPNASRNAPKTTNAMIYVAAMPIGVPKTPSVET